MITPHDVMTDERQGRGHGWDGRVFEIDRGFLKMASHAWTP